MSETTIDIHPQFSTNTESKPQSVILSMAAYITLLVRANETDPSLWPPGMEEGAMALRRVREIESDCIAKIGNFDWEKLPEDVQNEYDSLCALLDRFQDTGERIGLRDLLLAVHEVTAERSEQESEGMA